MDRDDLVQAAHWHARLVDAPEGPSRRAVEAGFDAWCRMREEHGLAYVAVTEVGAVAHALADQPALADAVTTAHARIARRRRRWRQVEIAAICGVAVITPVAALTVHRFVQSTSSAPAPAPAQFYQTTIGQRKAITLDDSTRILLDTASKLSIEGNVLRIQGQAYVAAGTTPIVVAIPGMSIDLRRGALNVRSDATRREVFVPQQAVVADVQGLGGPTTIAAGQLLRMDGQRPRVAPAADPAAITSWRNGWLLFDDVPLARAAAEINRYRRVPIRLAPGTRQLRISGSFRVDDNSDFLGAVAAALPATVAPSAAGPTIVPTRQPEK